VQQQRRWAAASAAATATMTRTDAQSTATTTADGCECTATVAAASAAVIMEVAVAGSKIVYLQTKICSKIYGLDTHRSTCEYPLFLSHDLELQWILEKQDLDPRDRFLTGIPTSYLELYQALLQPLINQVLVISNIILHLLNASKGRIGKSRWSRYHFVVFCCLPSQPKLYI
jgi:hypothetical protein